MNRIIDAHALMAFLEKEPGYEKVEHMFVDAAEKEKHLQMTAVNFGEVYYIILREMGKEKVEEIESIIRSLPIDIVEVDIELSREAAKFKAFKRMSFADCFAAALAKLRKGELVTGDTEFKEVEEDIRIIWIK